MTVQQQPKEFVEAGDDTPPPVLDRILVQLSQVSAQVSEIAKTSPWMGLKQPLPQPSTQPQLDDPLRLARCLYANRRRRKKYFAEDLLGEPGWDILLDLYVNEGGDKTVSVTSACIGSCVPPTTALRWIALMETEGLVLRKNDETDRRRAFIRLTERGRDAMRRYLEDILANR